MKSSARNQFAGPISALKDGVVDTEVTVQLTPELHITAVITRESAETLGLAVGQQVLALVKASSIVLVADEPGQVLPAISARNQLRGEISHIHTGPVNTEVTLSLPGGQHVLTAVITDSSVQRLGLALGQSVTAVFKAPSVFLVALD